MKFNRSLIAELIGATVLMLTTLPALGQEQSNRFAQLETLLAAKNWDTADRETISLIRNNPDNLSCPNLRRIDQLWMQHSNGKYGFTPQMQIWQKVGGLNCRTCEGEIKKFSEQVGWILGEQVNPQPGDFTGQYPTVAAIGWQRYVDTHQGSAWTGGTRVWEAWKIQGFNLFAQLNNCQTPSPPVR